MVVSGGTALASSGFSGTRFTVSCMQLIDHTALHPHLLENEAYGCGIASLDHTALVPLHEAQPFSLSHWQPRPRRRAIKG